MKNKFPPKWVDVYKNNEDEYKFFIALSRDPKQNWRSVSVLMKETDFSRSKIEGYLKKYSDLGMIFQKPNQDQFYGYWERVPEMLPKEEINLSTKNKNDRINKAMNYDI